MPVKGRPSSSVSRIGEDANDTRRPIWHRGDANENDST
jgi:hypothetical protein